MKPGGPNIPTAWRGLEDWLARTLSPAYRKSAKVVVEIGVDWGYSLWWWQSIFPEAHIYGVDPYEQYAESWAGPKGGQALAHVREWVDSTRRVSLIQKTSAAAASGWGGQLIDFIHIDGNHSYEGVKNDFYTWLPYLKTKCCVGFHDTVSHRDTVGRFVNEELVHSGLGKIIYQTKDHHGFSVWQEWR